MILPENPIPVLVAQYRKIKAQADAIKETLDKVRAELTILVEEKGNWKDNEGYARMVERGASVSYDAKTLDVLAQEWTDSDDPVLNKCAQSLLRHRREKAGYSYLQVK